jgi:type IV pilus assembly protein PilB
MTAKAQVKGSSDDGWLTQALVDAGVLQPSQAEHLQQGSLDGESSWKRAVREGYTSDYAIVQALVTRFKVKPADVGSADTRASTLLPESMARKYRVVVLRADDRTITVATADPRDLDLEENLRFITGRRVSFEVAPPDAINKKLDEIYRPEKAINQLLEGLNPSNVESIEEVALDPDKDPTLEAPMTKLVDAMISEAVRDGASDIHAEPLVDGMTIRYRIDGVL